MKIVTHSGHFHADELLAIATLLIKYPDAQVVRSREQSVIDAGDIVVDVGHVYDPSKKQFDHHQKEGAGKRANGVPYASFGLIWKEYGLEVAGGAREAEIIEVQLAMPIDAMDNGVSVSEPKFAGVREYSIGDFFQSFSIGAKSQEDYEAAFGEALSVAQSLLKREIAGAQELVRDLIEVEKIYKESLDKRLIQLPREMHWKKALIESEALFVVVPRHDETWAVIGIPEELHSYKRKKLMPASWSGLSDVELVKVTGVSDAIFCHRGLWLAGAKTKEGALKLAEIALKA